MKLNVRIHNCSKWVLEPVSIWYTDIDSQLIKTNGRQTHRHQSNGLLFVCEYVGVVRVYHTRITQ